jgi:hypothetical protein
MTNQDKQNLLIAEFMSFDLEKENYKVDELRYDCDWNWIIDVIAKIRRERNNHKFFNNMKFQAMANHVEINLELLDKESTYLKIVEFINYYNGLG